MDLWLSIIKPVHAEWLVDICNFFSGSFIARNIRGRKRKYSESDTEEVELTAPSTSVPSTRPPTQPLKKVSCFFCQKEGAEKLFTVRTENAGKALCEAMEASQSTTKHW